MTLRHARTQTGRFTTVGRALLGAALVTACAVRGARAWPAIALGTPRHETLEGVAHAPDGRTLLVGGINGADGVAIELTAEGFVRWSRRYRSSTTLSAAASRDDGWVVAGASCPGRHYGAPWVAGLDRDGEVVWQYTLREDDFHVFSPGLTRLPDGTILVTAVRNVPAVGLSTVWMASLTPDGALLRERVVGVPELCSLGAVVLPSGEVRLLGSKGYGARTAWTARLTASGEIEEERTYLGDGLLLHGLSPAADGGYLLTGYASGRAHFLRFDVRGRLQWARELWEPEAYGAVELADGSWLLTGTRDEQPWQARLMRMSRFGDLLSRDDASSGAAEETLGGGWIRPDGMIAVPGYGNNVGAGLGDFRLLELMPDGAPPPCTAALGGMLRFSAYTITELPPSPDLIVPPMALEVPHETSEPYPIATTHHCPARDPSAAPRRMIAPRALGARTGSAGAPPIAPRPR
jgi:hypothetical protein